MSGKDIDRKLRLTAATLGTVTRKDLAGAFRRVNPATTFDVERANKWLQGRARPRERGIYEDWAKVLDLGRPGRWIAESGIDEFIDALCARHGCERAVLERQERDVVRQAEHPGHQGRSRTDGYLTGTFASYYPAWSRYFRRQLVCGTLSIGIEPAQGLAATYAQNLPTGPAKAVGQIVASQRVVHVELRHGTTDDRYSMCLFRPAPPVSVLVGHYTGVTFLSSETELATSRVVLIRVPPTCERLAGAYLPADASLAADLVALGLPIRDPAEVDQRLMAFLMGAKDQGVDRVAAEQYAALTELFDRNWLTEVAVASPDTARQHTA